MQTKSKYYSGYLTVYLSLILGVVLSLLLALMEGAAIGATRLQAEIAADLGMDSVLAEYHRELLKQYGVFYIDDSYGSKSGGLGRVEQHLSDYIRYNCNFGADGRLSESRHSLVKLENPYLEIEQVSFATDHYGEVWKAQAIDYMKDYYGISYLNQFRDYLNVTQNQGLVTRDIAAELSGRKQEYEQGLEDQDIVETDAKTEEGYSYSQISDLLESLQGTGVLSYIMTDVSDKSVHKEEYISARSKAGKINRGMGLSKGIDKPQGIDDELLYGEYLMQKCGNYRNSRKDGLLDYEVEYILYGQASDMANLRECAERLLALRSVSNYLYLTHTDTVKKAEVKATAIVICTLLAVPELSEGLEELMLGSWAYIEAFADVKCLLEGGKVPLMKQMGDWNTDLWSLLKEGFGLDKIQGNSSKGLSYQDYLRIFLGMMNRQDKVMRSLDIVEMNIRQTAGNEYFRIDRCISHLQASFGFADAGGHEYVFTRSAGYQ